MSHLKKEKVLKSVKSSLHLKLSNRDPKCRGSEVFEKSFQLKMSSGYKFNFFVEKHIQQIRAFGLKDFSILFSLYIDMVKKSATILNAGRIQPYLALLD